MRRVVTLGLALVLAGCGDSDGDGLSNADEKTWGSDPNVVDSDGDGIDDGTEVFTYGTHPAFADSDSDGATDLEEIEAGVDPLDPNSRPYRGGWPILSDDFKDALEGEGASPSIAMGAQLPRFKLKDQFGDRVDVYDFADGVPVVIDISAEWCPPCRDLAAYLEGEENGNDDMAGARDAINDGRLRWVTVLGEDMAGDRATKRASRSWSSDFPHDQIPVLADTDWEVVDWANLTAWPTVFVVDSEMKVIGLDRSGVQSVVATQL